MDSPPAALWLRGKTSILSCARRVAIVGSRSPSPYGLEQAKIFAREIAAAGVVVVSGLARGIDQAAHEGALLVQGPTLAVLGNGVDRPWPGGSLSEAIAVHGLLLSEYAPGTPPRRHHFPLRNRLIAGLCQAVLVVEAAWASGSLITARHAADQGKQVFALPGRIDHPRSHGIVRLLREGATAVHSAAQLLDDVYAIGAVTPAAQAAALAGTTADPLEQALLTALLGETCSTAELAQRLAQPLEPVLSHLILLELSNQVARCPGGLWRRCT